MKNNNKRWKEDDVNILISNYEDVEIEKISKLLKRSKSSISHKLSRLGLIKRIMWEDSEILYLKNYFSRESFSNMSKELRNRSRETISAKAYNLGLKRKTVLNWTKEKDFYLIENYPNSPKNKIIEKLKGHSWLAIMARAGLLGVRREFGKIIWTKEKIKILRRYYPSYEWKIILKKIGSTDKLAISSKASSLGIRKENRKNRFFSNDDDKFIAENYSSMALDDICKYLGRTRCSITSRASKIGATNHAQWGDISDNEILKMLSSVFEELGRRPMWRELGEYGLPSGASFSKRFGGLNKAFLLAGITENKRNRYGTAGLAKDGSWCKSQSEISITNFLYNNKVEYEKETLYKNIFPSVKTSKRLDWLLADGTIVEFFGLAGKKEYDKKTKWKKKFLKKAGAKTIFLYPKDLKPERLKKIFKKYIL